MRRQQPVVVVVVVVGIEVVVFLTSSPIPFESVVLFHHSPGRT